MGSRMRLWWVSGLRCLPAAGLLLVLPRAEATTGTVVELNDNSGVVQSDDGKRFRFAGYESCPDLAIDLKVEFDTIGTTDQAFRVCPIGQGMPIVSGSGVLSRVFDLAGSQTGEISRDGSEWPVIFNLSHICDGKPMPTVGTRMRFTYHDDIMTQAYWAKTVCPQDGAAEETPAEPPGDESAAAADEPSTEPVDESRAEPVEEPSTESADEAAAEPVDEPVDEAAAEESADDPIDDSADQSMDETTDEPSDEETDE